MTANLTVLYDNRPLVAGLECGWGFACLVESAGHRLLFDTGWDADLLFRNARRLGLALERLDAVVISHEHWDHAGGLSRLLAVAEVGEVFVPDSFSGRQVAAIGRRAPTTTVRQPRELLEGCFSTGSLDGPPTEQGLVVALDDGVALITGCAHPGLGSLLAAARRWGPVELVLGGFHGFSDLELLSEAPRLFPCHCTRHLAAIRAAWPDKVEPCGVGLSLELS